MKNNNGHIRKKKGGCLKTVLTVLLLLFVIGGIASIGDSPEKAPQQDQPKKVKEEKNKEAKKADFTIFSNDAIGVAKHTVVGLDKTEPSGKYKVVCTKGHGQMTINDSDIRHFANDDKKGTDIVGSVYNQESSIDLSGNDVIAIRNHNSSDFELEFYLLEAGAEPEIPIEHKNALEKARQYSDTMYMSKQAIYDQLTSEYGEQFAPEAAQYAIDTLDTDYNRNALEKAKMYQSDMAMSKEAIKEQLISEYGERFTPEEAEYAVNNLP